MSEEQRSAQFSEDTSSGVHRNENSSENTVLGTFPHLTEALIGRVKEVEAVCNLLTTPEVRLVTLTGPGGVGKTSLAIEVAEILSRKFADGVFFVGLATIADPKLVTSTIAEAVGVREELSGPLFDRLSIMARKSGVRLSPVKRSLFEMIRIHLRGRELLLVLDNFEQVLEASAEVVELLSACDGLKVLVTSRARLNVRGEHEVQVPTLPVPDLKRAPSVKQLATYAAVELFVRQGRIVRTNFDLTPDNSSAIAEICVRLDGLPLALELAAARLGVLSPQALLEHLGHRLRFLTAGARDLPTRQRTLRETIAWSYNLLSESDRELFSRLGIFAGGCNIEGAQAVYASEGIDEDVLLEGLQSLLDKSLLKRVDDDEPRFVMLDTIREFACECLRNSGKFEETGRLHADFFASLVCEAEPELRGRSQTVWLDRLERENENLRAALLWYLDHRDPGLSLEISGGLWRYWSVRGQVTEGREWLSRALAISSEHTPARAKALVGAGGLASLQNDPAEARLFEEQALTIFKELGDRRGISVGLHLLGIIAHDQADYASARALYEESLGIKRELGDELGIAMLLNNLGNLAQHQHDYSEAKSLYEQSLTIKRELGDNLGIAISLYLLAQVACTEKEYQKAQTLYQESLTIERELADKSGIADCLEGLAEAACGNNDPRTAARLLGAAEFVRETFRTPVFSIERAQYDNIVSKVRGMLAQEEFKSAWNAGRSMSLQDAIAFALEDGR